MRILILFFLLPFTILVQAKTVTTELKDNNGRTQLKVTYTKDGNNVKYNFQTNSDVIVKKVGTRQIQVVSDNSVEYRNSEIYEVVDPFAGRKYHVEIVQVQNEVSLPIYYDGAAPISISEKYMINAKELDIANNVSQKTPKQVRDLPINLNEFKSTRNIQRKVFDLVGRALAQRQAWESFQNGIRSNHGATFGETVEFRQRQLKSSLENIHQYRDQLSHLYNTASNQIANSGSIDFDIPIQDINKSSTFDAVEIKDENDDFYSQVFSNISSPKLKSSFLEKEVQFNLTVKHERDALKLYKKSVIELQNKKTKDERYYELKTSQKVIEAKQSLRSGLNEQTHNTLNDLSEAIQNNNVELLISSFKFLGESKDFQTGLGVSLINNINPVGSIYEIELPQGNEWQTLGEMVGDAMGMFLGAVEMGEGLTLTLTGAGVGITSIAAIPVTGGVSAIATPVSLAEVGVGLALSAHGASVFSKSFGNFLDRVQNLNITSKIAESFDLTNQIKSVGIKTKAGIKNFSTWLKKSFNFKKGDNLHDVLDVDILEHYHPFRERGPLGRISSGGQMHVDETFRSSTYSKVRSNKHVKLYRAYDENGVELGGYWTRIKPSGPMQTTIDLALDPNWGNRTNRWIEITVPPNQIFYEGVVSDIYIKTNSSKQHLGQLLGGGSQVFFEHGKVDPTWITAKGLLE